MWFGCRVKSLSLLSQSSTVEQNVRLRSGKRQYVLASRLNFDAAQLPAPNQRGSLCSGLTKMYPEQQQKKKKTCPKTKPTAMSWPGGPASSPTRSVQEEDLPDLEVTNKTRWISWRAIEERSFPFELKRLPRGRSASPHSSSSCTKPWWPCKCSCLFLQVFTSQWMLYYQPMPYLHGVNTCRVSVVSVC